LNFFWEGRDETLATLSTERYVVVLQPAVFRAFCSNERAVLRRKGLAPKN